MKILKIVGIIILFLGVGVGLEKVLDKDADWLSPLGRRENASKIEQVKEKNTGYLAQYNFENLRKRENKVSKIEIVGESVTLEEARKNVLKGYGKEGIKKENNFKSYEITFTSNGKKISGMMNLPMTPMSHKLPAIIMIQKLLLNVSQSLRL